MTHWKRLLRPSCSHGHHGTLPLTAGPRQLPRWNDVPAKSKHGPGVMCPSLLKRVQYL